MKYWTSRTASKHLYSNECGPDCSCSSLLTLTMSSALPPAGGWGPLPERRFVARPTTPQLQKPPGCWVQLSSDTDTTNFSPFFWLSCISERTEVGEGRPCWIQMFFSSVFCGFLSVLLLKDLLCTGDLLRTQQPEDAWPVISGHTVYLCV